MNILLFIKKYIDDKIIPIVICVIINIEIVDPIFHIIFRFGDVLIFIYIFIIVFFFIHLFMIRIIIINITINVIILLFKFIINFCNIFNSIGLILYFVFIFIHIIWLFIVIIISDHFIILFL